MGVGDEKIFPLRLELAVSGPVCVGGARIRSKASQFGVYGRTNWQWDRIFKMYALQFSFVSLQATNAPYLCPSTNETKSLDQDSNLWSAWFVFVAHSYICKLC